MIYLDTSALAKWYLNEEGSDAFAAWIGQQDDIQISSLTATEMRCLLARRKRAGDITPNLSNRFSQPSPGMWNRHIVSSQ